jgi:hypothetical protein
MAVDLVGSMALHPGVRVTLPGTHLEIKVDDEWPAPVLVKRVREAATPIWSLATLVCPGVVIAWARVVRPDQPPGPWWPIVGERNDARLYRATRGCG